MKAALPPEEMARLNERQRYEILDTASSDRFHDITPLTDQVLGIFAHGFTTRKAGRGFGLHIGALVAWDLGGSLTVQSDGPGRCATFALELPCKLPTPSP